MGDGRGIGAELQFGGKCDIRNRKYPNPIPQGLGEISPKMSTAPAIVGAVRACRRVLSISGPRQNTANCAQELKV
jgi:hypothetical protein